MFSIKLSCCSGWLAWSRRSSGCLFAGVFGCPLWPQRTCKVFVWGCLWAASVKKKGERGGWVRMAAFWRWVWLHYGLWSSKLWLWGRAEAVLP